MTQLTPEQQIEWFAIVDELYAGEGVLLKPQQLPRRYGTVVRAVDEVLANVHCNAMVAGGWAVWRYGYRGRLSHDLDIVTQINGADEFIRALAAGAFAMQSWERELRPKLTHVATDVTLDILLSASLSIAHSARTGEVGTRLEYVPLSALVELKIAAGRFKDEADLIEVIAANPDRLQEIRTHLAEVHANYASKFEGLVAKAKDDKTER